MLRRSDGVLADGAVASDFDVALGVTSDRGHATSRLALAVVLADPSALFLLALKLRVLLVLEGLDLRFQVVLPVEGEDDAGELSFILEIGAVFFGDAYGQFVGRCARVFALAAREAFLLASLVQVIGLVAPELPHGCRLPSRGDLCRDS